MNQKRGDVRNLPRTEDQTRSGPPAVGSPESGGASEGLGALAGGIVKDLQDMVRGEVQLAKTELKEDVSAIGKAAGMIAAGALVGLVGFIFLMLALTYVLDEWLQDWLAAGIVALGLLAIAAILAFSGKNALSAANLKPRQTIETLQEDQEWAKQQISSVKR